MSCSVAHSTHKACHYKILRVMYAFHFTSAMPGVYWRRKLNTTMYCEYQPFSDQYILPNISILLYLTFTFYTKKMPYVFNHNYTIHKSFMHTCAKAWEIMRMSKGNRSPCNVIHMIKYHPLLFPPMLFIYLFNSQWDSLER